MNKQITLLSILLGGWTSMQAQEVTSLHSFEHALHKGPLAVLVFYKGESRNPQLSNMIQTITMIEEVHKRYVSFILVNVDKMPSVAQQFNITQLPTVLLCKQGTPLMRQGKVVALTGYPSGNTLMQLIEEYFDPLIAQMVQARAEYEAYRKQVRVYRNRVQGFNPYWCDYWGWPAEAYYPARPGQGLCE